MINGELYKNGWSHRVGQRDGTECFLPMLLAVPIHIDGGQQAQGTGLQWKPFCYTFNTF